MLSIIASHGPPEPMSEDDPRHARCINHRGNDRGDAVRPGPDLGGIGMSCAEIASRAASRRRGYFAARMAALREPLYPAAVTAPGRGFSPSPVQNPSRPAPLYGGAFFWGSPLVAIFAAARDIDCAPMNERTAVIDTGVSAFDLDGYEVRMSINPMQRASTYNLKSSLFF